MPSDLASELNAYLRLMRFDRPVGIWLLLWPTLWGLWLASEGHPTPEVFTVFVLGVIVMRAAGCVINDIADSRIDSEVARTRNRPLATGEIQRGEAIVLFVALGLVAVGLVMTMNPLTQLMAVGGALLTMVYPLCKRFFAAPQLILGMAFGWAVPMAFAAETGEIPRLAWLLFVTITIWAMVYDTMYAMVDRNDDLKIGVKSTAIMFGSADVFIVGCLQVCLLLALVLVGETAELGSWYLLGVAAAGLLSWRQHWLISNRDPKRCFQAFLNNQYIGAAVFAGIALEYTFRL